MHSPRRPFFLFLLLSPLLLPLSFASIGKMKNCALLLILSLCVIALGADTPHERYTPVQPGGHVSQGGHVTGGELGGDEVVTVSLEEWDAVTSQVVKQNDFLIKDILSRQCSVWIFFSFFSSFSFFFLLFLFFFLLPPHPSPPKRSLLTLKAMPPSR